MTPFTWNADREKLTPTQFRTVIGGGWRNYIRRGYAWQPINSEIQSDLTITTFPGNVQFAANSQDWSDVVIDGTFSMKRHLLEGNGHNAEPEFTMSLAVETQHNVAGHIDEDRPAQVVYPNAWDTADLRLGIWYGRSARIEKVVEIHSMPSGDSETVDYSFLVRSNQARVLAGPNFDVSPWAENGTAELNGSSAFIARLESQLRGLFLETPVAWYYTAAGQMVRTPVRVSFQILPDGETVRATKHIPRALIATALAAGSHLKTDATFTPEVAGTVDGVVKGSSTGSWATLLAGSANYASDTDSQSSIIVEATGSSNTYSQYRHLIFTLDTSSIGAGQQNDATTWQTRVDNQRVTGTMGLSTNIYASTPASNTAVTTGDYMAMGSTPFTDTARLMSAESFDDTTIVQTLNAAGRAAVDMEGITKLGMGVVEAHESGSPSWASNNSAILAVYMAEHTTPANRPVLTVTHSTISTFTPAWALAANPSGY